MGKGVIAVAVAVLLGVSGPAPGEAQLLRGRLLDDATGVGIDGARVLLLLQDGRVLQPVLTGSDGSFQLRVPAPGWYRLRAQRIGYLMTTSPPLELTQSESLTVEFRLSAQAVTLAPVTVVGRAGPVVAADPYLERRGFYEREVTYGKQGEGFGYFLEGEQLRPTAFRLSDLLRDLPGINIQAAGGSKVRITGRRGCEPILFLDGVPIVKRDSNENVFDEWVAPTSIAAVEVYPGPVVPAQYLGIGLSFWSCGAVVVWTGVRPS